MNRKLLIVVVLLLSVVMSTQVALMQDGDLGSETNPIQVYFVPSVEAATITTGEQ